MKLNIQLFADGKVVIETDLNKKGFEDGLNKMATIAAKGFKAIASTVGVASAAIGGLVANAVKMNGELEQQIGGTEAVFGDFADKVQKEAVKSFSKMGTSANDFMATANKMGALMQGSGISVEDSMDLSMKAMQRTADVASIMGIDINDAMNSIAGAAKGNFTMMDNLGVAMNATSIEAYAMSKGIEESYSEMDQATKIGLAMEMFLEKTTYAEKNYEKENKTFAGSLTTLKAALNNFMSGAGGMEDVADSLVNFGEILFDKIQEMAPTIINGIIELVNKVIKDLPSILNKILPAIVDGGITLIKTLLETLLKGLPELLQTGITLLLEVAKGILKAIPDLLPVIVDLIFDIMNVFYDNYDQVMEVGIEIIVALIEGIMNSLPVLLSRVPEIIIKMTAVLIQQTPTLLAAALRIILALAEGFVKFLPELISRVPQIIKGIKNALLEGVKDIKNVGKNLINGLWEGIQSTWNGLKSKVESLGKGIVKKFQSVFKIGSPSKVFRDEIGKYLAQGVGVGFEDEIDNVYRDMQNVVDLETSKMSANVQTSGTYQMAMAGLPTFNLLDNTENTTQLVVNGKVLAEVVNSENRNREVATA